MLRNCCAALLLLFAGNFACGIESNWKTMNLTGGKIMSLAHDPYAANVLLAAGAQSIYKTTDGGASWTPVLNSVHPYGVAFAPSKRNRAYAESAYAGGIYRSDDAGSTWTFVSSTTYNTGPDLGLTVDPADENILYGAYTDEYTASTPRSVYKSVDGGASWTLIYTLPDDGSIVTSVSVPAHNTVLFTTTNKDYAIAGSIYRSNDAGATWTHFDSPALSLAANPYNPAQLYAGGYKAVFKSADYGATWSSLSIGTTVYGIVVKSTDDVVACSQTSCGETMDGGSSWSVTGPEIDSTLSNGLRGPLLYSSLDTALYIADSYNGAAIYKSAGSNLATLTFSAITTGLYNVAFASLLHDPVHSNAIYATSGVDFYASVDSGATWLTRLFDGKRAGTPDGVNMLVDSGGTLYAGINRKLRSSTDFGATWTTVSDLTSRTIGNILALTFDPKDPNILYMGTGMSEEGIDEAGFYRNPSKGSGSWTQLLINSATSTVSHIAVSSTTSGVIYAASYPDYAHDKDTAYLYKTTDGGTTWTHIPKPLNGDGTPGGIINTLALDPDYDGMLYVANDWYVLRSADAGVTWTTVYYDLHGGVKKFIVSHPSGGARVMYVGIDDSVYMSINEGSSWKLIGSGFNGVKALAYGSLYVATSDGLYKTDITAVQISTSANTMFVSSMTSGATVTVTVPPGAFSTGLNAMMIPFTPGSISDQNIKPSALGIAIELSVSTQPASAVTLLFNYTASDISGLDPTRLAIVRLDDTGSGYTLLPSTPTPSSNSVVASTMHLSSFTLVQYTATPVVNTTGSPLAYPLPFNPLRHTQGMTIKNLSADTQVSLFNIVGQLIRRITVPASGTAVWDGRNDAGKTVASGIYIALVKDQAQKTQRLKIAVEK